MKLVINRLKVKELMAKKQLESLKDLAACLDITPAQLSNILSEKYTPVKSNVKELADFLGVSPLELIKEIGEQNDA